VSLVPIARTYRPLGPMRRASVAVIAATLLMGWHGGRASADDPLTIQNAVGNTGNTSSTAAVGTRGNVNQNSNQNANLNRMTQGQGLSVGSISIDPSGSGDPGGYSGQNTVSFASPNTAVNFGNSQTRIINFSALGLPGIMGPPGNFTQPYKPDVFVNGAGPVRPSRMTLEQASDCKGGWGYKDRYVGSDRGRATEISLLYAAWDKIEMTNDISKYVGISSVEGSDKPWLPAVCEAAYHAMQHGANLGIVEFILRPKNKMAGFGFGSSGGASGTPNVLSTSPYALAGTLGFGVGWSSQKVEAEVMIQLTGLKVDQPSGAAQAPPQAAAPPAPPGSSQGPPPSSSPATTTPLPATPSPAGIPPEGKVVVPNGGHPVKLPPPLLPATPPGPQPGGQGQPGSLDMHLELIPAEQGCAAPNCTAASYLKAGNGATPLGAR
jgi:hypothetical protein